MAGPNRDQLRAFEKLKKTDANAEIVWDERLGTPNRLRGNLTAPTEGEPESVARNFVSANSRLFSIKAPDEELRLKDIVIDRQGNRHIRYQQMYHNIPVFGRELIVHLSGDNVIRGTNGRFMPDIELSEKPQVSSGDAKKKALDHAPDNADIPGTEPVLLVLVHEDKPFLCWQLTVAGTDKGLDGKDTPAEWAYFIDASSGKVIWRYNNLPTHTKTTGTGSGRYAGSVTLNTIHNHTSSKYELEDQWVPTGARIRTHDCNNGFPPAALSADNNNSWSAASQETDVDCHYFSRIVFDYYLMIHGRDSYDDGGADMEINANCGNNWNNASWSPSQQVVKIGNGDGTTYDPFCTLDIIAHEWTHALTEHTAGLIYSGESGALNESMSDVFAALIDGDWLQGEDNWLLASAPAGRNLADPTNGGQYDPADPINSVLAGHQPDHMDDKYTGWQDNGGVHINSGIMNKAAYLIAVGGTHRGITMCEALGNDILGRLYYQALTGHLTGSSDFADMRDAVLDSLDDLYSGDPRYGRWRATILNAFAAVGIGTSTTCPLVCWIAPSVCPPSPHVLCPPSPTMMCPPSPRFVCPPSPGAICPPSPIVSCPPAPDIIRGCLPGPDPGPFVPKLVERLPVAKNIDIQKIAGIGKERAAILRSLGISTVDKFIDATKTDRSLEALAEKSGISVANLRNWRTKSKVLYRSR